MKPWNFFGLNLKNTLNCENNCEDHAFLFLQLTPPSFCGLHSMNYSGSSVSEPQKIAKSLIFFVESIASSNKDNVEECDHSKLRNFISRACLSRARLLKCRPFFFLFFRRSSPNGRPWSQALRNWG